MISVCMPYFDRFERLCETLASYEQHYYADNLEIVICDDGSPEPLEISSSIFDVNVVRIEREPKPLNPCVAINTAVKHASGDIIALTSPEVLHEKPVLRDMCRQFFDSGEHINTLDRIYLAARCTDAKRGILAGPGTPENGRAPVPDGGYFPFFALLSRQLWLEIDGYDEDYREGQGYDDNDFLWRLDHAGVTFLWSNEVVTHVHEPLKWQLPSNEALFYQKWPQLRS